jgi:virginiamycin B lyase
MPKQSAVKLQTKVWPEKLAFGSDGSLWMTGKYWGVARLRPDGHLKLYRESLEDFAFDLTVGPDGALWFAGDQLIGRIDQAGHRDTRATEDYGIPRAITVADGAIWYAATFNSARIVQIDAAGTTKSFAIKGPRALSDIYGLTQGPDGALWFTEEGYHAPDGIGRITTGGQYQSWSLPGHPGPIRIAAGPDGALWFTERNRSAIGQITTAGKTTEFPLLAGVTAHDITPGQDGALWFTTDSCIGRMTTSGQATTWHVRGAAGLDGIVAAPDGSFWLADPDENTVHHFVPPADNAPPLLPCGPRSVTVRSGSTVATVSYQLMDRFGKVDYFVDPRVQITRDGVPAFSEVVPKSVNGLREYDVEGASNAVTARDLDGDGEPELMLTLNWGGAHCCSWSRIYRYNASRHRYVPVEHFWGNGGFLKVRDLNGDRVPEFISVDDRFAYDFDGYAGSVRPIQIWSYRRGVFRDVTRRFPNQIDADAKGIWRLYLKQRGKKSSVRGILPAWAADEYMLGRGSTVDQELANASEAGYLDTGFDGPSTPAGYIKALQELLRKTGYIRSG